MRRMEMRVLQIIEPAYRATLEEQDDTALWFTRAIRAAGAEADVLLMGSAVNYAVRNQNAAGLTIGSWVQLHPPEIESELRKLMDEGARISIVAEDVVARGLGMGHFIEGVAPVSRETLGALFCGYDRIWKW
jgi:hypothetical protein